MREEIPSSARSSGLVVSYLTGDTTIEAVTRGFGLEVRDFILMSFLAEEGPLTTQRLAELMTVHAIQILTCVKRLAGCGLVVRDPIVADPDRVATIVLTESGRDVMQMAKQDAG